ncbi:Cu(I)/Ag(I) efflux system membrane fusion protein [Arcticibacter tournemirensis]|uniref:Efflux RND transporter periplasmic adaptor subunit n=1 Tax=Arcticibacter tournemirensis TaxID=699437 RepID=A0A5M9GNI3_9SPHI|nr:efflux RND transporter periplasmic adaptor subunit [Arcticibacter tournemirensis]KAA8476252.1 efflux RND transporter periplasmic adaptor subunit [Arcticibacter tournemirensis]TQM49540.1 Cu(I)/Ag(I) efflux system membrane fusion protein [Arcticibacter tournemirensis]
MKKVQMILVLILIIAACKNAEVKDAKKAVHKDHNVDYYTCSMHPQVIKDKPGNCPICGMKLIKVSRSSAKDTEGIQLNEQQMQLGNIITDTIGNKMISDEMVLTATINVDQRNINAVSARVMGRIERLYFKNTGDYVRKGDRLFDIYSEDLNNAKQEYILALEKQKLLHGSVINPEVLVESAKKKLELWGLSLSQIKELEVRKTTTPVTTYYSPVAGYILSNELREGEYVTEGGTVVRLADLSTLWAEAQIYSSELYQIDRHAAASVQFLNIPGRQAIGAVQFVAPEIADQSRIILLRVQIPNSGLLLKPGMPASVTIKSKSVNTLTLPSDAVLRVGNTASVWVQTGNYHFKNKMVETGMEEGEMVEIKSGLQAGDIVVIQGAYLLNSEYIFKQGANPMEGMKM